MTDPTLAKAILTAQAGPGPDDGGNKPTPIVDNKVRQGWNDYVDWLDKKGLKGNPMLDHNNLSFKMIEQYRKENPDSPITADLITPIQKDFGNYRKYAIDQIEKGKGAYAPGTNKDNFLSALSQVDGIPGQRTTSYKFPHQYMATFDNGGKVANMQDQGFATAQ